MRTWLSVVVVSGLVLGTPTQAQDQAAVFRPAGNWTVDFGDDYCRLMRTFRNGDDEVALALERIQPGAQTGFILVGDGIKTFRGADQIGYTFAAAEGEREARYVRSETAEGKQYLNLGYVTLAPAAPGAPPVYDRAAEETAAKAVTSIGLAKGLTTPVRIETGTLGAPMKVLQECADDLAKSWGIDPLASPSSAVGGGSGWLPQGTIPPADLPKLRGGANQVRLMIDASGKPAQCAIYQATLSAAQNEKICALLMANGKFTPARNPAGDAVAGYWIGNPQFLGPPMSRGRR